MSVVFFCMPEPGHWKRLLPLIAGLRNRGLAVHALTHESFRSDVERAGGAFIDLFAKYPIESADAESLPVPCRFVSFAGVYADEVTRDVQKLEPSLIVYDTFAVIGRTVAQLLQIPYVNVCAGHNVNPERFMRILSEDDRVDISPECFRAVDRLRERFGMNDASPFSYVSALSPYLNVYCEPPAFLDEQDRSVFQPIAFFGSLAGGESNRSRGSGSKAVSGFGKADAGSRRIYVSFGTVVWRYYRTEALQALQSLSDTFGAMSEVNAVLSLGGFDIGIDSLQSLTKSNVRVESYVDQRTILSEADLFVTHHGLNSTHEAIFHEVPMISYPFFWDQPALAAKCKEFDLAIPLTGSLRSPVEQDDVRAALAIASERAESLKAGLARAHEWERSVIGNREAVLDEMIALQ